MTDPAITGPAMTPPAKTGTAITGTAITGTAITGPAITGPAITGPAITGPAAHRRFGGAVYRTNLVSLFWSQLKGFSNESLPQTAQQNAALPGHPGPAGHPRGGVFF